jgi:hypothetical protein
MIKGPLENFIRQAYFGGNSDIFLEDDNRCVEKGFHYDMNSQFPFAMKKSMPTGNPVFSNNTNLDYYKLGFVFAKITPPTKDKLLNLFIQQRNEDGSITCPREVFYEYISTEDLRQGLKYGYKADVICGVNFPDACDEGELFGKFVDSLYFIKTNSLNSVDKITAKLILNSTYGKFAQKDQEYHIKLLEKSEADKIVSKYHYSYFSEISKDLVLIKYGGKLNDKLRKLYIENINDNLNSLEEVGNLFAKNRGVPSAVQISAMIASYARVSINEFKNIPDNLAIASNTDSIILRKTLPDKLIGKELGQFKLEHEFTQGVFVRPKLYCYYDSNTKDIIRKASGVNANKLSYEDYLKLSKGENVLTNKNKFNVDWANLEIKIVNENITLKGLKAINELSNDNSDAPKKCVNLDIRPSIRKNIAFKEIHTLAYLKGGGDKEDINWVATHTRALLAPTPLLYKPIIREINIKDENRDNSCIRVVKSLELKYINIILILAFVKNI